MGRSSGSAARIPFQHTKADAPSGRRERVAAAGGLLGALAASSCCIVPLLLFSVGAGGAWVGSLAALAPHQPVFVAISVGFLGYGYYLMYRKRAADGCDAAACARPVRSRAVKGIMWGSTVLVVLAVAFPWYASVLLGS